MRIVLAGIVACMTFLCACGVVTAESPPQTVIWNRSATPSPLGVVEMVSGESKEVSLSGAADPGRIGEIQGVTGAGDGILVNPMPDTLRLKIEAAPGAGEQCVLLISVSLEDGSQTELALPVLVTTYPVVSFEYEPPAGKSVPESVALAGEFNGWSMDRDLFEKEQDGVFRLEKAIEPGTWKYKLVVDGEWMPDPSNPQTDGSEFNNSIIEVEGEATEELTFRFVGENMAGEAAGNGFIPVLNDEERILPEKLVVIANNKLLDASQYTVSDVDDRITVSSSESIWGMENYLIVVGETTSGRRGVGRGFFTYSQTNRSPRDEVIYFPMTDRFADGAPELNNPADDSRVAPLANYTGGDWEGIRQKIDEGYFDELGVTAIWLSPANKNTPKVEQESVEPGGYYTSYHGYWPISSTETNEQFGSMDDLKNLVETAHEHGIAILLDFVANHVHEDHPIYQQHPEWVTDYSLPNGEKNLREFDAHPLTTWFDDFMPTLNYAGNEEIRQIMQDNAVYWLKESGADGFRHDAVKHLPVDFWQGLTTRLNEEFPDRYIYQVGETISGYDLVARYVGPDLMPGQFDFPGYFAVRGVLGLDKDSMVDLANSLEKAEAYYPASAIMSPLIGNHDVSRFMAFADGDLQPDVDEKEVGRENPPSVDDLQSYEKIRLAYAWLMTIPGAPMVYYGDEIGMTGAGDPDNRRPMIWDGWNDEQIKVHDTLAKLGKLRQGSIALRRGNVEVLHADPERLVFARLAPEETTVVTLSRLPRGRRLFLVELPDHWGDPTALTPLIAQGQTVQLKGGAFSLSDTPWSFGIWRVEY